MAAKKKTALEVARSASGAKIAMRCWLDDLGKKDREDVIEAAREICRGELTNISAIARAWQEYGLPVTRNKLKDLITKVREGAI